YPAEIGTGRVTMSLSTVEYFLDRRLIDRKYEVEDRGQNLIVQDLIEDYVATASRTGTAVVDGRTVSSYMLPGIPLQVITDGGGKTRTRKYYPTDQATVYQRMQELSSVWQGPEWVIEHAWDGGRIIPTLYVADRLGTAPPAGYGP